MVVVLAGWWWWWVLAGGWSVQLGQQLSVRKREVGPRPLYYYNYLQVEEEEEQHN